jgi:hypothetical protein
MKSNVLECSLSGWTCEEDLSGRRERERVEDFYCIRVQIDLESSRSPMGFESWNGRRRQSNHVLLAPACRVQILPGLL